MVTTQQSTVVEYVDPNTLKAHPFNVEVYGNDGYHDLVESIKELGVVQSLYAKNDGTVISGHRRWRASLEANASVVPVIRVSYPDELSEHEAIIEHNRYRVKNGLQLSNEVAELEVIERVRAEARKAQAAGQPRGVKKDSLEVILPQEKNRYEELGDSWARAQDKKRAPQSRDIIGKKVGLSGSQVDKLIFIKDNRPDLLPQINVSKTLSAAYRETKREDRANDINRYTTKELEGLYNVFYADPPWQYDNNSTGLRGLSEDVYPVETMENISSLPVQSHCMDEAVLFLWTTTAMVKKAFDLIPAWGFEFKTSMVWVKNRIGTGFFVRSKHEYLLISTKGSFLPMTNKLPESVIFADTGKHSQKPSVFYEIIEQMYPNQRYCELYARGKRDGWYSWGNEV